MDYLYGKYGFLIESEKKLIKAHDLIIAEGAPSHHLAFLEKQNHFLNIQENKGIMIYFIQSFLVERIGNSFRFYKWDLGHSPCYDEKLQRQINFEKCQPTKIKFYKVIGY